MVISIIAAMAKNRVIGRGNELPWRLPSEHRRFKEITMGHAVIMGRKTFESIGHPLPGRRNIIITRRQDFAPAGCEIVPDLRTALAVCAGSDEVFICGGESIFHEAMPLANRIYLTIVDEVFDGDAHFPEIPDSDIVFKSFVADYQEGGGDLELVAYFTAGKDEYSSGSIFDPTPDQRKSYKDELLLELSRITGHSLEVLVVPDYNAAFGCT